MAIKNKIKIISLQNRASLAYFVANIVTRGLNFITIPIFTRILTTNDMGSVTMFNSWQSIIYVIVTLSMTSGSLNVALMKYSNKRDEYLSTILSIISLSFICFLLIFCLFRKKVESFFGLSIDLVLLLLVYSLFNPAVEGWCAKNRYEYKYLRVIAITIVSAVASTVCSLLCVKFAKKNMIYSLGNIKIISQNFIMISIGVIFYIRIYISGKICLDRDMALFALKESLPLIIHSLAKNILDISDRLMIAQFCGKSEAGIYGTVYTISTMSLVVWTAVNSALIPDMFEKLEKKRYDVIDRKIRMVLIFFSCFAVLITLFGPEILMVFTTAEYYGGLYIIPAVSAGIYLTALYNIYGNVIQYKEKSIYLMLATLAAAVLNILLNYFGISKFGYIAAAYSTLISFVVLTVMQGALHRRLLGKNICGVKFVFKLSATVIMICLLCSILYSYVIIRYTSIIFLLLVIFLKRKQFIILIGL